ncbi:MAG: glycosyltransferase family 39 protein [Acidobacteriaceae bacterium]|nr:glycosyltransferase family 39 protein [Acidobacteriaceae bacterium]
MFLRISHLGRPVRYDEAFTYTEFASHPLRIALSHYGFPNNHLLNTLLIHLSTSIFGNNTVALRLPALIAGCLTIPASWLAGRALYGPLAGILSAGCIAALPTFIEYSINARGYTLQWLSVLALMWLGTGLYEDAALKSGWLAFLFSGVVGLYSVPTTIIPILGISIWILLSAFVRGGLSQFNSVLKRLLWAGLAIGLISTFLYLPVLVVSGPDALLSNRFVVSGTSQSFLRNLASLIRDTWMRWTEGVPEVAVWILIAGLILGTAFHRKVSLHALPMTLVLWVSSFLFAWARNVVGYPRVWSYLLLAAIMTAAAGLSVLILLLAGHSRVRQVFLVSAASTLLSAFIGAGVVQRQILFLNSETGAAVDTDQIANFLLSVLRPGDRLVATSPVYIILDYELQRRNPKLYEALSTSRDARRVIAVVSKQYAASESVRTDERYALLAAEGAADPASILAQIDVSAYNSPRLLAKFLTVTVYSFEVKQRS